MKDKMYFEEIRNKGIEEGQIAGRKEGIKVGRKEGRQQERLKNLKCLMNNCQMSLEEAMNTLNIFEEEREYYRKQLNQI